MTDAPTDHTDEMVIALTPVQLGIIATVIIAVVVFRRIRKCRATA